MAAMSAAAFAIHKQAFSVGALGFNGLSLSLGFRV